MEAGLKPFDTEQMSGYQKLMSGDQMYLTIDYGLKSVAPTRKAISDKHKTFNTDQLSGVETLKSFNETLKPFDVALKSSARLFQESKSINAYLPSDL